MTAPHERRRLAATLAAAVVACMSVVACAGRTGAREAAATVASSEGVSPAVPSALAASRQLVVVTTPGWDSTSGTLRRYERASPGDAWHRVGAEVPVVVGRTGLAWSADPAGAPPPGLAAAGDPRKREGDGRSPAGAFPLDTAFGFAPADSVSWLRVPYVALGPGTECVDDGASAHYNTVVDRALVRQVDWTSSEKMRQVGQYRIGVIVGYNAAPPRAGRGSCIFLHIWNGPASTTAGCTAFDPAALDEVMRWLDRDRRPAIVQLPASAYERLRAGWALP